MKKIAIATATRAEYGILHPLLVRLMEEKEFDVQLLVTGTHLEEQFGYTVKEIEKDGIPIARKIPILAEDNSPYGISVTMAQAITGFADYFRNKNWYVEDSSITADEDANLNDIEKANLKKLKNYCTEQGWTWDISDPLNTDE